MRIIITIKDTARLTRINDFNTVLQRMKANDGALQYADVIASIEKDMK